MHVAGNAGDGARADPALRDLVAQILVVRVAVGGDHLAAVDVWFEVQHLGVDAQAPFRQQQVAQHDGGALVLVRDVEDLGHQGEAVGNIQRSGDDAGEVSEGCAQRLPQVALFGLGGHSGGWACAHAVDGDNWNLRHGREAEAFGHEREASAGGGAHGANAGMRRADGHVDDADLVFYLTHQDAGLASVPGHPVQYSGGGAHGVGAVELAAGCSAAHGQSGVAAEHGVTLVGHGQGLVKGLEVGGRIVVSGSRDVDVFRHHGLALLAELCLEDAFQHVEADAHHAERSTQRQGVLRDLVARDVCQRADRQRTELDAGGGGSRLDGVSVVDDGAAVGEQAQVAVHGVLVQRDEEVHRVALVGHLVHPGADGQEGVAAADDGLIGVIGVQVQPAPAEDECEDVARCCHALAGCAANAEGKCLTHKVLPTQTAGVAFVCTDPSFPCWREANLTCRPEQTSGDSVPSRTTVRRKK